MARPPRRGRRTCRREHPEVAIGGAVARDGVPDHHAAPGMRQELGVDQPRHLGVADDRAHIGEVRERRQPERRAQRVEAVGADAVELGARLLEHPQLRHERGQARVATPPPCPTPPATARPGPARRAGPARGGSRTSGCRRRWTDRGLRAGGSTPATARPPPRPRVRRPSHSAIAAAYCSATCIANGWRMRPAMSSRAASSARAAVRSPIAISDATRHWNASAPISMSPSCSAMSRPSASMSRMSPEGRRSAQPVGAAQHEREAPAVADAAGHGDRLVAHQRALLGSGGEGQRPAERAEHAHAQLASRPPRAPRPPPRAARARRASSMPIRQQASS